MKNAASLVIATLLAVLAVGRVAAADELILYAIKDGAPYEGASVRLDGSDVKRVPANGIVVFDLSAGGHGVQILDGDATVHSFRFDSASGQLVDITVAFTGDQPQVSVESYSAIESAADRQGAPSGTIGGRVTVDGEPAANATLTFDGSRSVTADSDGRYQATLPRGEYSVEITHPAFDTPRAGLVRVVTGLTTASNFSFSTSAVAASAGIELEEMMVVASFDPGMFGESEQFSDAVVDTIGIEEIARYGDSDIAATVVRVPAVTVQDGRYVFIRGLGDRYITTSLNGATMPSTDPDRRTVPLDLFPANIVDQLTIRKTFLASAPGESTGGNLVINTRSFPDDRAGKVSISLGGNSSVTGKTVATDPISGDWDFWGVDDTSRKEPGVVEAIAGLLDPSPRPELGGESVRSYLNEAAIRELQKLGAQFIADGWDLDTTTANPNLSVGANYGDLLYIGDYEIGVFAAGNYKNGWSSKEGIARTYDDAGLADDYQTLDVANNIDASGLLSVSVNIGNHTLESVSLLSRVTESSVQQREGFAGDARELSVQHTINWEEQQYWSQQFRGEHSLSSDWFADWQLTASQAWRYAPDRRQVQFNQESNAELYSLEVPELERRYDDLYDDNLDGSVNFGWDIDFDTSLYLATTLDFGAQAIHRERDSDSHTYGFQGGVLLNDDSPNLLVSEVINESSITGDISTGYAFSDKTLASDSYDAEMDLNSVYLSADTSIGDALQVILGVRYEMFEQTTNTFSPLGDQSAIRSLIDEDIALPTLAVNYSLTGDQQIRFGVSQTVSRPDFKESSNAVFYDTDFSDIRVRGNPLLGVSEIINYDLRWEWYGDVDNLSVALFYKDIQDAIERVALTASGTAGNSRTFQNSDSAEIYGIELDGRKEFALNDQYSQSVFVAFNGSWIESEVSDAGMPGRQLQGQPEYTFNLILGWDDIDRGQELTLLFNQSGQSIRDVGVNNEPDIIEEPRPELNLTWSWRLSEQMKISAKAKNLLDAEVEFTQGGQPFRRYQSGVGFEAGFEWAL